MSKLMIVLTHIRDNFSAAFFPRLSEWACATAIFFIGVIFYVNAGLMAPKPGIHPNPYALMLTFAPQPAWSNGLIAFGFFRLVVLLINGAWRRSPHLRSIMAILSCLPFYTLGMSYLPVFGVAMVLAFVFLGMDVANAVRAAGDARIIDHAHAARGQNGREFK